MSDEIKLSDEIREILRKYYQNLCETTRERDLLIKKLMRIAENEPKK